MIFKSVLISLSILVFATLKVNSIGKLQSLKSRGQVFCDGIPIFKAWIRLVRSRTFKSDEYLDAKFSDMHGYFKVNGSCSSIFTIKTRVEIYHTCGILNKFCFKKWIIPISTSDITNGAKPRSWSEIGNLYFNSRRVHDKTIQCRQR